jgi:hypothetical protein
MLRLDRSMRFTSMRVIAIALVASALIHGAAGAQQAADTADCFAQPRVRPDSAAPGAARGVRADTARGGAARGADVILIASVSARELRFQSQPRISVRLCGGLDSVRVVERRNLPERVVPGVTYRDVYVAVEILGHVYADCLRESLAGGRASGCPTATDTTRATPRRPR